MFDPQLVGYWGSTDLDRATETFIEIVTANAAKIEGVKISLLDARRGRDRVEDAKQRVAVPARVTRD